jgi:CubicO group peptidase (beta-lactamase class C family)
MDATAFLPPQGLLERIAPTQDLPGRVHWGEVHDAAARWMGGVAGHAGVFSTGEDLSRYAQMMLNRGVLHGTRVLSEASARDMTARPPAAQTPRARGLGWELGGPEGLPMFPEGTYGHLGYTGTMIWIDPARDLFAVVLTHRVYPDAKGDAAPLRRSVIGGLVRTWRAPREAAAGTRRRASSGARRSVRRRAAP